MAGSGGFSMGQVLEASSTSSHSKQDMVQALDLWQ
jgi:hypothetical protein